MKHLTIPLLSALLLAVAPTALRSHGGQVNAFGCHTESHTQTRHCHTPSPNIYQAEVIRVVDGDTIEVNASLWLELNITAIVRLRGIDAPEISRAECNSERQQGEKARQALEDMAGQEVILSNLEEGKFGGRIIADVLTLDRRNIANMLMEKGLVRSYDGKERRSSWCV